MEILTYSPFKWVKIFFTMADKDLLVKFHPAWQSVFIRGAAILVFYLVICVSYKWVTYVPV